MAAVVPANRYFPGSVRPMQHCLRMKEVLL
jgi:hypothetical protein